MLFDMALWIKKNTGKNTRIITSDGGGVEPLKPGIELGFIEALDVSNWANPFAAFKFLSEGWWPVDPTVVNSPLKPGFKDYKLCPFCSKDCGAGMLVSVAQCRECKKPIPPGSLMKPVREPINGMENVGGYGFEGLTSWGERLQFSQADKVAVGESGASAGSAGSEKGGSTLRFQDGSGPDGAPVWVAGNAQPHYGASVDYLARFVRNTDQLPGWKVWTALERKGKDEETGKAIMGPALPGRAGTDRCIPWFNSVLHLVNEEVRPGVFERVLYCNTHIMKELPGVPWKAKLSVTPTKSTPSTIKPATFHEFIRVLDQSKELAKQETMKELGLG